MRRASKYVLYLYMSKYIDYLVDTCTCFLVYTLDGKRKLLYVIIMLSEMRRDRNVPIYLTES